MLALGVDPGEVGGGELGTVTYTGDYRNRPNQCPSGTSWDGWTWFEYGCGCPSGTGRNYRCHDGCRRLSDGSWGNSICRWPVSSCLG